jgi:hypothetical protein
MVGVVSTNNVDPLGLSSLDVVLSSKFDGTLIGFRSGREEYSVRQTSRSMTDQHLAQTFSSEIRKTRCVVVRQSSHLLGHSLDYSLITMSDRSDSSPSARVKNSAE